MNPSRLDPPHPGPTSSWLRRCPSNPVLAAGRLPYPSALVFNAGVARFGGRYACIFRNESGRQGDPVLDGCSLGLAFSGDGLAWEGKPEPLIDLPRARAMRSPFYPASGFEHEVTRFYDPRLVVIEEWLHLCFALGMRHGLRSGIAVAQDDALTDWELLHLTASDSRNLVPFPERVNGLYRRLERTMNEYGEAEMHPGRHAICASESPDLRHRGNTRLLLPAEDVAFATSKIGTAAPPIRTDAGWLCFFQTMSVDPTRGKNGREPRWQNRHDCGVMLLELDGPARVLARASEPLMVAQTPEEKNSDRNDVIFPTGLLRVSEDVARIYDGAADTVLCVAKARIDESVEFCLHG